jgi:murein DD-endopeptidase MepM/ murein hydrolase activator NlpD
MLSQMVRGVLAVVLLAVVLLAGLLTVPGAAGAEQPAGTGGSSAVGWPVRAAAADGPLAPAGSYSWPLPGFPTVVRDFDPPPHPFGRGHRGVDLAGAAGGPVLAAGAGTVVFAGPLAGRGVVSIDHPGGLRTTYEPVLASVAAGELVERGQQIGTLEAGHPGCASAACLHWGLRRGADYLDPLQLLAPGPLRLMPWEGLGD